MSLPNATKPILAGGATTAYQVSRSLRFNSADSALLTRVPISTSNQRTFTWSGWVKRSTLSSANYKPFFASEASGSNYSFLSFYLDNITWQNYDGANNFVVTTTALFRDPASWCHIVCAVNTTNATSTDRVKIYANGILQTVTSGYPSLNYDVRINTSAFTAKHGFSSGTGVYFDGYLANIDFIDGQALTPSSFAQTDATTGQWVPKAYAGTYGTNGFKLTFSDNSAATAATLGADSSGNGNNFTPTNLSVTAGVGNDSLTDTPTQYGSDTGAGGEVRGNYCTLNPLAANSTLPTNGNLSVIGASSHSRINSTFTIPSTGKWYWECSFTSFSNHPLLGVKTRHPTSSEDINAVIGYRDGTKYDEAGASSGYAASWTTADLIGVAFDSDAGTLTFYKNNVSLGVAFSGLTPATISYTPCIKFYDGTGFVNFGQRAFTYTAPSGHKALCVQNLSTPTIVLPSTAFDAKLYTGTGSSQSITGLGFNPDLVWIKSRSAATDNTLYDSVRGAQARLESNTTDVEVTSDAGLTAFNATGFTVNTLAQVNTSAATYVGWCWDESVSAGFDIVTYTGDIASNRDVAHSLGVAPKFIIIKDRSSNAVNNNWSIWHTSMTSGHNMYFDTSASFAISGTSYGGIGTAHTSSTFRLQNGSSSNQTVNESGDSYVAYLWADVAGFSKFGSYTGNGAADGPFVHCGFKPRFIMQKNASGGGNNWRTWDSSRYPNNENVTPLCSNTSDADAADANGVDMLSNGFKVRLNTSAANSSGLTYIFMAFAESPFKYANAK